MNDTVTISVEEYEELKEDALWAACLDWAGVDNWEGYDQAVEMYQREKGSTDE